jgi:predicted porin
MSNAPPIARNQFMDLIQSQRQQMKSKIAIIIAALSLGASATGFAQDGVTIYGVADTGMEYINHGNANGSSVTRMPAITGELPSRWGLRGEESLGGGVSTIFTFEAGLNLRDGSLGQGGRSFGRQAWVGAQGPYGNLTIGRIYTMSYWAILVGDLLIPDIYAGTGSFDNWVPNERSDNSIAYRGTWNGFMAGFTYSLGGRDASGTGNSPGQGTCDVTRGVACREWSALLRYNNSRFGMAAAYDEERGGSSTAAANFFNGAAPLALAHPGDKDVHMQLAGNYVVANSLKIGGGWIGRRVSFAAPTSSGVRSNQLYLTAAWNATPSLLIDGGVYWISNHQQNARGTIVVLRTTYSFSKRTAVYWQGGYLFNSAQAAYTISQGGPGATPGKGMNQLGMMVGIRHSF